jgi:hypothetical protein
MYVPVNKDGTAGKPEPFAEGWLRYFSGNDRPL